MNYPCNFRLEVIADDLATTFEAKSGSEPSLIAHHIVADARLVPLLATIYELSVHQKHDAYVCLSDCQFALHRLIERVLPIVRCIWWALAEGCHTIEAGSDGWGRP